eukprot:TRINITY_DN24657_c0_g1_i2.p1 TRINITY_DN24657_c0_g1~~TRINITY_DN24657_c0_g1_i2.p1  ORF type:complete len:149 (-),score=13.06 TRINITY_DN24657_c0_g1_i2:12-458(-)
MKGIIKSVILRTLKYKPNERLTIKEVVSVMREFEDYATITQIELNESLMQFLMLDKVGGMAELSCGHKVSNDHLTIYALKLFIKDREYKYQCMCTTCGQVKKIKSLPLSRGYVWTKFGENIRDKSEFDYNTMNNIVELMVNKYNANLD